MHPVQAVPFLLALAAAPALRAEKLLHNQARRVLVLKVERLDLGVAAIKLQTHTTGKTPKVDNFNIFLEPVEDSKAERKVFLNEELGGLPEPMVITLASGTAVDAARPVRLKPGASLRFWPVLTGPLAAGAGNRVMLRVHTIDSAQAPTPTLVVEGLTVTYDFSADDQGKVTETLKGGVQPPPEGELPRVAFAPLDPFSGVLTLEDPTTKGCGCVIQ